MNLTYLACPYTHQDPKVRDFRRDAADKYAAILAAHHREEFAVFSPISQGPRLEPYLARHLATDHRFWMKQCIGILRHASLMIVLPLHGWRESRGVQEELEFCENNGIPVKFLHLMHPDKRIDFDYPELEDRVRNGWGEIWV